jgi:flagellar biosynthesis/type III secretory pathway M-ring protein FliF/YscJ
LIFLVLMRRALKRREHEESVPEPTWLREIVSGQTVAELQAGSTLPALPAVPTAEQSKREEIRDAVEEIANNKPEAIASQVATWMKE